MKLSDFIINDKNVFIDESETSSYPSDNNKHSRQEQKSYNIEKNSMPPPEYVYTEIVKAIGNDKFIEKKRVLQRASWCSSEQNNYGLPPTGKQTSGYNSGTSKISNRVRMRSKPTRHYQVEQSNRTFQPRPISYNENYDYTVFDRITNQALVSIFFSSLQFEETSTWLFYISNSNGNA